MEQAVASQDIQTAESRLVENICNSGGVRVQPRVEDLHRFVTTAAAMDSQAVARLLVAQVKAVFCRRCQSLPLLPSRSRGAEGTGGLNLTVQTLVSVPERQEVMGRTTVIRAVFQTRS